MRDAGEFAWKSTRSSRLFSPGLCYNSFVVVGSVGWGWLAISGFVSTPPSLGWSGAGCSGGWLQTGYFGGVGGGHFWVKNGSKKGSKNTKKTTVFARVLLFCAKQSI